MPSTTIKRTPVVGDILYTHWGYDETHYTFYKVLAVTPTGKTLKVQRTEVIRQPCGYQERLLPIRNTPAQVTKWSDDGENLGRVDAPILTVRWQGAHAKVERNFGWLWDGQPLYGTHPAWGR